MKPTQYTADDQVIYRNELATVERVLDSSELVLQFDRGDTRRVETKSLVMAPNCPCCRTQRWNTYLLQCTGCGLFLEDVMP